MLFFRNFARTFEYGGINVMPDDMEKQDKKARLQVIRTIVGNCPIENQEELAVELEKAGFSTTQTMLSRDLKQLRISKVRTVRERASMPCQVWCTSTQPRHARN